MRELLMNPCLPWLVGALALGVLAGLLRARLLIAITAALSISVGLQFAGVLNLSEIATPAWYFLALLVALGTLELVLMLVFGRDNTIQIFSDIVVGVFRLTLIGFPAGILRELGGAALSQTKKRR